MQSRNIQRREVQAIGEAWGKVQAIVGLNPRMYKKGLMLEIFKPAMPEFFMKKCPVPAVRHFMLKDHKSTAYNAEKLFAEETEIKIIDGLEKEVLNNLVRQDSRLMWDHEGVCPTCGKRTYLFSQCLDCLKNENDADEAIRSDAEREEDLSLIHI